MALKTMDKSYEIIIVPAISLYNNIDLSYAQLQFTNQLLGKEQ